MNVMSVFRISASALEAQRRRMNVIASNLANVHSTKSEEGGPYRRQEVLFAAAPVSEGEPEYQGVRVIGVVRDERPFRTVYDPGHPDADKDGYVALPNVNVLEEMVDMMTAYRAYEASVSAFNLAKSMFLKALELGRG